MDRNDFLNAVIDDGIMEISTTYLRPDQKLKREGGIAGFEACRGMCDKCLVELLSEARSLTRRAQVEDSNLYWRQVMYERQIEWTLNVLSAAMYAQGLEPIVPPTVRGLAKAADILGVTHSVPVDPPRDTLH